MNNDLISREALKAYARKVMYEKNATNFSLLKMFDEIIDNAPTVKEPQGEWKSLMWVSGEVIGECPFCGGEQVAENYCSYCGARLHGRN